MKKLIVIAFAFVFAMYGCKEEINEPVPEKSDVLGLNVDNQTVLSEIQIGDKIVSFVARDGHVGILERFMPGEEPVLDDKFEGFTLAEIHQTLAPGRKVPEEIMAVDEKFGMQSDVAGDYENASVVEGDHINIKSAAGMREEGLNDIWFRDNYCNVTSFWNGYKACLLNRYGSGGDWAYSNCSRSRVYVYPFQGGQVHLRGQVNGSTLFDADLLVGYVYSYYMFSGKNFWGCRTIKKHYYSITNTSGDGWHWNLRSNTNC